MAVEFGLDILEFIGRAKIARLATVDSKSIPYLVPVVFVFDDNQFFLPIDEKKKKNTTNPKDLKRVKNIQNNSNVCLLIDEYSDDWSKLSFVMINGIASVMPSNLSNISWRNVYEKLSIKYPQYQLVGLSNVWIVIRPQKLVSWHNA